MSQNAPFDPGVLCRGRGGASRSQSALHMHVLVCICSNVRQFQEIIDMIQMCYHTNLCACWPCFVNTKVFLCYKTVKGTLTLLSFIRVTLRVLAPLGQVTWTETVSIRGGLWSGDASSGTRAAYTPLRGIDGCEGAEGLASDVKRSVQTIHS